MWHTGALTVSPRLSRTSLSAFCMSVCTSQAPSPNVPLHPHLASNNNKSHLFFCKFACCWSIIYLQHYVDSWYTTQWVNISIRFKMITMISMLSCHYTKILYNYWLYSPHCVNHLFFNWKFVPLNFHLKPKLWNS